MINKFCISFNCYSMKLSSIAIPSQMKLKHFDKNEIYDIHRSIIEKLFYNDCFPDTFSYLNSLKQIDYLTLNKKDETKIKKATEQLHSMFISATEHVLKDKSLYKLFNVSKNNWRLIGENFNRTKNDYFYGRMDLGFSFDLNTIKLFEYNTGLCGDIYDTTDFQNNIFNHFVMNNPNNTFTHKSLHSGYQLISELGQRWKELSSKCNNKTVYFIASSTDKEEQLVLSSIFQGLKRHNIKYKLSYDTNPIIESRNGILFDKETKEKIDILYKTHPWYCIFRNLNCGLENCKSIYRYCLNKKTKIVEPMWKTVMGNKALLPYVYSLNRSNPYLIPSSFDPFDECFEDDEWIIEKGLTGRGSMSTRTIRRKDIKERKNNVIYQRIFTENKYKGKYYIMGSYIVGKKFSGMFIKQSEKMINEYSCNVIPVRILI